MANGTAVARKTGPVGTITIPAQDPSDHKIKIPQFNIASNASVRFVNKTRGTVRLSIHNGGLLFVVPNLHISEYIPDAGELTLSVSSTAKEAVYPYDAYCEAIRDYAVGKSAPVIVCP
jgi:hypothetical protein